MTMYPVLLNNRPTPVSSRRISRLPVVLAASCALAFTLGVTGALANSQAGGYTNMGGYTGPGPAVSTVEQAKAMRDDTHLALRGRIVHRLLRATRCRINLRRLTVRRLTSLGRLSPCGHRCPTLPLGCGFSDYFHSMEAGQG